jgi:hypothetical protein
MAVRGLPKLTMVRGEVVAEAGRVVGRPGSGRLVTPKMPPPAPRNLATTMRAIIEPGRAPW